MPVTVAQHAGLTGFGERRVQTRAQPVPWDGIGGGGFGRMFHDVKCTAPSDPAIPPCRDLAFHSVTFFLSVSPGHIPPKSLLIHL